MLTDTLLDEAVIQQVAEERVALDWRGKTTWEGDTRPAEHVERCKEYARWYITRYVGRASEDQADNFTIPDAKLCNPGQPDVDALVERVADFIDSVIVDSNRYGSSESELKELRDNRLEAARGAVNLVRRSEIRDIGVTTCVQSAESPAGRVENAARAGFDSQGSHHLAAML